MDGSRADAEDGHAERHQVAEHRLAPDVGGQVDGQVAAEDLERIDTVPRRVVAVTRRQAPDAIETQEGGQQDDGEQRKALATRGEGRFRGLHFTAVMAGSSEAGAGRSTAIATTGRR